MRSIVVQVFAVGLVLASEVLAAPLEIKQVAADAKWLAHLDLDAVRASTVVQRAWQKGMEKHNDVEIKLGFVRSMLGMDPTQDVHGITCYGKEIGQPAGVIIVAAAMDPQRITGLATLMRGRESSKYGDYEISSWTHQRHKHAWTIAAAFRGNDQLVLAHGVDDVKAALDVLDGKAPGLTDAATLAGNVPAGCTFLLRVQGIAQADLPCEVPVVKQIDSFRLVTGENEGQSFFRARLTMTNPEVAAVALTAVQGWKAQGNLLCPDELGRKFINAVNPKADGQTLTLLWSVSADDVWEAMQKIEKSITEHMAKRSRHGAKHGCPLCQLGGRNCPLCDGAGKEGHRPRGAEKKSIPPEEDF